MSNRPGAYVVYLYRLYDNAGALLYIGVTDTFRGRFSHHALYKPWWPDVTQIALERYPSAFDALEAEREAIEAEAPIHNVQWNRNRAVAT